jgi:hypothetical protein
VVVFFYIIFFDAQLFLLPQLWQPRCDSLSCKGIICNRNISYKTSGIAIYELSIHFFSSLFKKRALHLT